MTFLRNTLTQWLGSLAKKTLRREQPLIIAITGAVGKSTTKQMLAAMLRARTNPAVRVTTKNYNNQLGVPLTVFDRPAPGRSPFAWLGLLWTAALYGFGLRRTGVKTFVFEMGADHPGDLEHLTTLAPPDISVVTAVTLEDTGWAPVHAANYASIDELAHEKATLVRAVSPTGTIVLNADDARVIAMRHEAPAHLVTFGTTEAADVQLLQTHVRTEQAPTGSLPVGLEIRLAILQQVQTVYFPGVFGRSAAFALAAAAGVGLALDLTAEEMVSAVQEEYRPLPGRVRLIPGIKGTMLLDDSYNASPVAVLAALRDLASIDIDSTQQRKIVCLGEMRELGPQSTVLHEQIGMAVARLQLDLLLVTGAQAEAYARGALQAGMSQANIKIFDDTPQLALYVQDVLEPGDLVLAKASEGPLRTPEGLLKTKGVRLERVIQEVMSEPNRAAELLCRQEPLWQG